MINQLCSLIVIVASLAACKDEIAPIHPADAAPMKRQYVPGQHPFTSPESWDASVVADLQAQFPTRCTLHDQATKMDTVAMRCGTVLGMALYPLGIDGREYARAKSSSFPNANWFVHTDYDHLAAKARYCQPCREAECEWLEQHRAD